MKRIIFIIMLSAISFSGFAQQNAEEEKDRTPITVDIIETTEDIELLVLENAEHENQISENYERMSFLKSRISESESRVVEVDESIEYANVINLELNQIRSQTNDRAGKSKIDKSRQELVYLLWKLRDEKDFLTFQTDSDVQEVEDIIGDNERRQSLIEINEEEILWMELSIEYTQELLNGLEIKLDNLKLQLNKINSSFDGE